MCVRWLIRRCPRDFGHTRLMNAVQQFSPSDKQDEICALTFKEQTCLLKNVVWVRKVTFFIFFQGSFFQPIWMLRVSCIRAVYFTDILLLVTPVSCAGSAVMGESAWLRIGLCITGRIVTSPWCLKSLAVMQEPGKSTTRLSHPRLSPQCCQLKKIWT